MNNILIDCVKKYNFSSKNEIILLNLIEFLINILSEGYYNLGDHFFYFGFLIYFISNQILFIKTSF